MIPVTKTFLPPKEEYVNLIEEIWKSNWISNGGNLHLRLSEMLKQYLQVQKIILTTNGTLPLQIALKALAKKGEVITTPFSYVATTSTIIWESCTPIFVDIHPDYLTIDESKIEAAITDKTTAILATHVFGNPCNVEQIEIIAKRNNLKVIYDGAHAFGVNYKGSSLFNYGDVTTCSFHATKLFHTGEGGAMFCENRDLYHELFYSHNFGHDGALNFHGLGINAKMSELQAGMGLAVLPYVEQIISNRKEVISVYDSYLDFTNLKKIRLREGTEWNFSYYPTIFPTEEDLLIVMQVLNQEKIFPRRYFYPSLNTLDYVTSGRMPVSENISQRILCLPLYQGLKMENVRKISDLLNEAISGKEH